MYSFQHIDSVLQPFFSEVQSMRARSTLLAAAACVLLAPAATADQGWELGHNDRLCYLARSVDARPIILWHMRLPNSADGGTLQLSFRDAALKLPPSEKQVGAVLEFNSGDTIDGYSLSQEPHEFLSIMIANNRLKNILSVMEKSTSVNVKTHYGTSKLALDGLASSIPSLVDCAKSDR